MAVAKQCEEAGERQAAARLRERVENFYKANQQQKPLSDRISAAEWRLTTKKQAMEKAAAAVDKLRCELKAA